MWPAAWRGVLGYRNVFAPRFVSNSGMNTVGLAPGGERRTNEHKSSACESRRNDLQDWLWDHEGARKEVENVADRKSVV